MKCEEARLLIGADPNLVSPELNEHLKVCTACSQFQREMTALESDILRALEQPPALKGRRTDGAEGQGPAGDATRDSGTADHDSPDAQQVRATAGVISGVANGTAEASATSGGSEVLQLRTDARGGGGGQQRTRRVGWSRWAMAASVALVVFAAAVWTLRPSETLAHEVVAHVQEEPLSWGKTAPVTSEDLNRVLRKDGISVDSASGDVVYAQRCLFRGHGVPHLVVKTARGPVTVMILRYVDVKRPEHFQESGMTGVISPAPHGSIAVLARGAGDIDDVAQQLQRSVHWLPDSH